MCVSYLLSKEKIGKHQLAKLSYHSAAFLGLVLNGSLMVDFDHVLDHFGLGSHRQTGYNRYNRPNTPSETAKLPQLQRVFPGSPSPQVSDFTWFTNGYPFCQAALWPKRRVLMVSFEKFSARN